ncbi:hypothetical protein BJ878DRAFT_429139 [Calycina marina]|uniref:Vacuolar protein sorting/targeting protein 10 n=1 Tax=Calycina marina TaxID=1763456 RepID=A0A9P7YWJ2_9HELO|nr:hypothetical protein BJ878DRAFT_429139 [Calycina marina]
MLEVVMHPYDNKRAFVITEDKTHWKTSDRGKSWQEWKTDSLASIFREALTFHAGDADRMIFNAMDCTGIFCEEITMVTTDGFSKSPKFLRAETEGCYWAKGAGLFTTGQKDLDANRILCVAKGKFSPWRKDYRLMVSDNYFQDEQEFEPELEPGRTVQGVVNMAVKQKYLLVAASADGTDEMALYVTDDTIKWHRAVFPHDHKLKEEAYTVLEGTNYSIQIDVMTTRQSRPMGVFLSSNSNGTYFTRNIEHTNRDRDGFVDFEKVSGIQGIVLVNTVKNWEAVLDKGVPREIRTEISFDDGRNFRAIKVKDDDLHLHSVTELSNSGRVFSSPAPGLVMGIGNTGTSLKPYKEGNLYVSDDAGATWFKGLDGPHKYEFGDQGSILVAIADDGLTDEVKYSINHGKDWKPVKLESKIKPLQITTTKDSTSLKFIVEAVEDKRDNPKGFIIALDFDDLHEGKCKDSDIIDWYARVDDKGEPTCIMGHTQSYKRRKADADCFIKNEFVDPVPITKPCDCTDMDFECDFNFVRSEDRMECKRVGSLILPEGACKAFGPDDTFEASPGWRLIPGNDCKRISGPQKDDKVKAKCSESVAAPADGKINNSQKIFKGDRFEERKIYLERTGTSSGLAGQDDETVIAQTDKGIFLSHDHGKQWKEILENENIVQIYPHYYFNDVVFFVTSTTKVFYSMDRGENIEHFEAPTPPNREGLAVLSFHPKYKDWFIWIGAKDCESQETCHSVASITQDRGDSQWKTLMRYVGKCEFIREPEHAVSKEEKLKREKLIYCEAKEREDNKPDNPMRLISSNDFFNESPRVHLTNVVDFATMSEFIVVATRDDKKDTLSASASVNGENFAQAEFPHGFSVEHQKGYTVLDSSTHAVFLHVTTNNEEGLEYGSIIKSNSNGTSYVMSLEAVDRDTTGFVDFEKLIGLEGIAMVNVVANAKSKNYAKEGKKLKSVITHNDGAEWDYLKPPALDPDGKKFGCKGSTDKCSLNLHSYTERNNKAHTFYSNSAIGLMMGTGNVGEYLKPKGDEVATFFTPDGGVTWKSVKNGEYMWEFGDQGSIVVIVKDNQKTDVVYYTLDEGDIWQEYKFADEPIMINDLTTVPSDNARNFLLWGKKGSDLITINLDFAGLTDVKCVLDEKDVTGGDYYLWKPKHPKQDDDCFFGHVSQYHRKRVESKCYNGPMIPHLHDIANNCTCTRRDFECDFNFERGPTGECILVQGYQPQSHKDMCAKDPALEEYYDVTGYRRIPMTTCQGGQELDVSIVHPCPGFEAEFGKRHGASGIAIFFAILIPLLLAGGVGFWVYRNWEGKFGQIRLGEQSTFDDEAPWVKFPVMFIAGLVAVAAALPLVVSGLWKAVSNALGRTRPARFTTRDSFARGRGNYAVVDDDEGELLGEDSDEEV